MQIHLFDQNEFNTPDSEQMLRIAFARKDEFASAINFLAACPRENAEPASNRERSSAAEFPRDGEVREYLAERLSCLPEPVESFGVVKILSDEWNDLELLLESSQRFLWYHWYTTA